MIAGIDKKVTKKTENRLERQKAEERKKELEVIRVNSLKSMNESVLLEDDTPDSEKRKLEADSNSLEVCKTKTSKALLHYFDDLLKC